MTDPKRPKDDEPTVTSLLRDLGFTEAILAGVLLLLSSLDMADDEPARAVVAFVVALFFGGLAVRHLVAWRDRV